MNCRHSKLWPLLNELCITETLSGEVQIFYKDEITSRLWSLSNSPGTKKSMTTLAHGPLDSLTLFLLQAWAHCWHTDFRLKDTMKRAISSIRSWWLCLKYTYFICIHVCSLDLCFNFYRVGISSTCFKEGQHQWKREAKYRNSTAQIHIWVRTLAGISWLTRDKT